MLLLVYSKGRRVGYKLPGGRIQHASYGSEASLQDGQLAMTSKVSITSAGAKAADFC